MKAIILARVSDKKQDSNEAQLGRIADAPKRFGVNTWKTYEIEESSTKGDRIKFQEIVEDIKDSKEPILLVVDTVDRLQRGFRESVLLDDFLKGGKLQIHFFRENLTINKDSNSSEFMRWDMAVMFARNYVLQLSDNVKRKQKHMLANGELIGRPPIGYESVYDENLKRTDVVLDLKTSHLIKRMFELYATGNYSTRTVRTEITKDGLKSKVGKPLALSMVDRILNNTFYYGMMVSVGKSYPHKYQPLITKELFDKCQRIRKGWNKKPFAYASKPFILRGLVRCDKCGCSMSPDLKKEKYVYYSCTNAKKDLCSTKYYIREEDL
ncbi:MAG: recombinase family protein, partial [Candidatus Pacebacteria bacterium]|nr:recombinase family protein [Candidatus Paceibacterota bacterium]